MKSIKKMLSTIVLLVCGLSICVSTEKIVKAENVEIQGNRTIGYDDCDVNHDGNVDSIDVVCMNRFLSGDMLYSNYRRFDVNNSSTVDTVDMQCVAAKILGLSFTSNYIRRGFENGDWAPVENIVSFPYVTPSDLTLKKDIDAYSTAPRAYTWKKYKQNYANSASVPDNSGGTYNIYPSSTGMTTQGGNIPRSIIGSDDMHNVLGASYQEASGIVYINGGTGFIVGDHEIATAAHMVVNDDDTFASEIVVYTRNGSGQIVEANPLHVIQVHVPSDYLAVNSLQYNEENEVHDYALLVVSEQLTSNAGYEHFMIGSSFNCTDTTWTDVPINITGRPTPLYTNGPMCFKTAVGSIYGDDNTAILRYTTDTLNGSSGSPVYTITKYQIGNSSYYEFTALGLNACHENVSSPTYNAGPLFTKYHRLFYLHNPIDPYAD